MTELFEHDCVVVGLPIYNEERFIAETIRSLKAQDWQDFLVLISDNASTDRTEEICRREIADDPRFHYVRHNENFGAATNFNFALEATRSPFFMWLGGHDMVAPDFLGIHLRELESRPECSLSYALTQWIDEAGSPVKVTDPSKLGDIKGSPLSRYFASIRRLHECTAINSLLRRSAIGLTRFTNVVGCDKVLLSELLFNGPANLVDRPLYLRRVVDKEQDYMERLTGQAGQAWDEAEIIPLYLASLARLPLSQSTKWLARRLLKSLLARRIMHRRTFMNLLHLRALGLLKL